MIDIKTYQDLIAVGENEKERIAFILEAINDHKSSEVYKTAVDADAYFRFRNPTIMRAQQILYNAMGQAKTDPFRANHKIPCHYYTYLVIQAVQFLLGNGVSFSNTEDVSIPGGKNGKGKKTRKIDRTKERLGKKFDYVIQKAAIAAMNGGVSFLFWNNDHVELFDVTEFVPLYDEENGSLRAGIRFWQLADNKPLRCTLYELDGLTEYIKPNGEDMTVLTEKKDYLQIVKQSDATGTEISNGGNYPGFPIVPFYNVNNQSEIVGNREIIDAYDLMASALVNNIDDADVIYWIIRNAGGMDAADDQAFIQRLKTLHVAHTEGEEEVDAHTVEVPFEASETALNRLRNQLFDSFMALDVKQISSGAATATEIKAAYEPLNSKTDLFEYQVTEAITALLELIGIDDTPTYTRSMIVNQQEMIANLVAASEYLSDDYITRKVLEILGDADKADEVLEQVLRGEVERFAADAETETE